MVAKMHWTADVRQYHVTSGRGLSQPIVATGADHEFRMYGRICEHAQEFVMASCINYFTHITDQLQSAMPLG